MVDDNKKLWSLYLNEEGVRQADTGNTSYGQIVLKHCELLSDKLKPLLYPEDNWYQFSWSGQNKVGSFFTQPASAHLKRLRSEQTSSQKEMPPSVQALITNPLRNRYAFVAESYEGIWSALNDLQKKHSKVMSRRFRKMEELLQDVINTRLLMYANRFREIIMPHETLVAQIIDSHEFAALELLKNPLNFGKELFYHRTWRLETSEMYKSWVVVAMAELHESSALSVLKDLKFQEVLNNTPAAGDCILMLTKYPTVAKYVAVENIILRNSFDWTTLFNKVLLPHPEIFCAFVENKNCLAYLEEMIKKETDPAREFHSMLEHMIEKFQLTTINPVTLFAEPSIASRFNMISTELKSQSPIAHYDDQANHSHLSP